MSKSNISKMNLDIANSYYIYEVINSINFNIKKNVNLMKNKEANGSAYFLSSSEQSEPKKIILDIWFWIFTLNININIYNYLK